MQLRGGLDNVPHLDRNSISIPLKGGREGSGCAGMILGTVSPRNNPGAWASLTKFDPVATKLVPSLTIWKCHTFSLLFEGYLTHAAQSRAAAELQLGR